MALRGQLRCSVTSAVTRLRNGIRCGMRNVPLFFCLMWSSASAWQRTFGYRSFPQHYSAVSQRETEMFSHQVSDGAQGAMLTYSWIESGAHPADRYVVPAPLALHDCLPDPPAAHLLAADSVHRATI